MEFGAAESFPSQIKMFILDCTAISASDSSISFQFVRDGCGSEYLNVAPSTIEDHSAAITFKAFLFEGSSQTYFECYIGLCLDSETQLECLQRAETCPDGFSDLY